MTKAKEPMGWCLTFVWRHRTALTITLRYEDKTLQKATAAVIKAYYARLRTESEFYPRFDACVAFAEGKTSNPVLPRHWRIPAGLNSVTFAHRFTSAKEYYRKDYFESCDLLMAKLKRKFKICASCGKGLLEAQLLILLISKSPFKYFSHRAFQRLRLCSTHPSVTRMTCGQDRTP